MSQLLREKVEECIKLNYNYAVFLLESGGYVVVCVDPKSGAMRISEVSDSLETKYFY